MKATELMVGDWVYCEGQPTPENVTIQTIAEDRKSWRRMGLSLLRGGGKFQDCPMDMVMLLLPLTPMGKEDQPILSMTLMFHGKSREVRIYT